MIGYGVAATCFAGLGITLVVRRESGVLKRIRATPLPPATYILAVLGSTFIVFLIEAVLIIGIGPRSSRSGVPRSPLLAPRRTRARALCFAGWGSGSQASSASLVRALRP